MHTTDDEIKDCVEKIYNGARFLRHALKDKPDDETALGEVVDKLYADALHLTSLRNIKQMTLPF